MPRNIETETDFDNDNAPPAWMDDARDAIFAEYEAGERPATKLAATPFTWRDESLIPPRKWLYGRHLLRKFLSVDVAAGGVGEHRDPRHRLGAARDHDERQHLDGGEAEGAWQGPEGDARVQGGRPPLGLRPRTEGALPEAGDRDRAERAATSRSASGSRWTRTSGAWRCAASSRWTPCAGARRMRC